MLSEEITHKAVIAVVREALSGDFLGDPHGITSEFLRAGWATPEQVAEAERRGAERALRSAADACRRMADQAETDAGGKLDRWDAFAEAEDWCLLRADRLGEGGGEG